MSRPALPYLGSRYVAGGLVALAGVVALGSACSDRETPTDVTAPAVAAPRVTKPSLAVGGNKPTSTLGHEIKSWGIDVVSGNEGIVEVLCTAGKKALGGGFQIGGGVLATGPDVYVYESSPRVTSGTDGWRLDAVNRTGETRRFDVWVICAAI